MLIGALVGVPDVWPVVGIGVDMELPLGDVVGEKVDGDSVGSSSVVAVGAAVGCVVFTKPSNMILSI